MDQTVAARLFVEETSRFGVLYRDADWSAPVPTCGDWTATQLFRHLGRGKRWAAKIVADRATEPVDPRSVPDGKPPDDADAAIAWLDDGAQLLIDAVAHTGAATDVWTFNGLRPAAWWVRRRLHETLVHRADAALAFGVAFDVAPELAADCVTEWVELQADNVRRADGALADGASIHLHATDDGLDALGEWTIRGTADGITWEHDHGKGDVALRGSAHDLLLAITRRRPVDALDVTVFGDRPVWDTWLNSTPF